MSSNDMQPFWYKANLKNIYPTNMYIHYHVQLYRLLTALADMQYSVHRGNFYNSPNLKTTQGPAAVESSAAAGLR